MATLYILPLPLLLFFTSLPAAFKWTSSFAAALQTLQKQIGYEFREIDLLRRAMTHPSYSRENCRALSILGLAAVESSAALRLLRSDADASAAAVSDRVSQASNITACSAAGDRLGLPAILRVATGTNASSPAVVCNAFRAMFGAVAVDAGGIDAAAEVFWRVNVAADGAAVM
ncbi:protein NUCLEAR FUSION DEFECTIVE 2 isoform X2 [Typha angustifolia]|uniref:protein NUCLEAR FUSION DEFECTIVE 2 isoform X2 n=1 Tax=Typha angustifolia TaxID=59011 RepID=UPI003C2BB2C1